MEKWMVILGKTVLWKSISIFEEIRKISDVYFLGKAQE